jgi:hypothetical protein
MKPEGEAPAEPPPTAARQEARPPERRVIFEGGTEVREGGTSFSALLRPLSVFSAPLW